MGIGLCHISNENIRVNDVKLLNWERFRLDIETILIERMVEN